MKRRQYAPLELLPRDLPASPLVLPWSALCSDNERYMIVYGQERLSTKYRGALKSIAEHSRIWWRGAPTIQPVFLWARFWFPDLRKRDAGNYRKALTDALSGIVYDDDRRVSDERYTKVGIDRDRPRCEVTLSWYHSEDAAA